MSAKIDRPKKYSLDYSLSEDSNKISHDLKKGYLKRRDVTELVDHIQEGTQVAASFGEKGKIQWTIGDTPISPTTATNKTPFWLRRIVYFFSWNSKKELKEKVGKIKQAYETLIAKTAEDRQKEETRLAEELQTLAANEINAKTEAAKAKMEAAKEEISSLKNELAVLQEDARQTESHLQAAEVKRDRVGIAITALSITRIELREALGNLIELDQKIENNFFGTWTLTDEEKFKLGKLEHTIFGEISDKLNEKEFRIIGKEILNQKIQGISDEIEIAGQQLSTTWEVILELESADLSKKEEFRQARETLDALTVEYTNQGLLPLEEVLEEPIQLNEPPLEIKPVPIVEKLIDKPLDFTKILNAQHIDTSPLFNKKILFTSICNEDEFYKNSVCPAIKSACLVLTPNQAAAQDLYTKWEIQIKDLAALWKNSGSGDQDIDSISLSSPFILIEKLDKLNHLITAINYKGLKLQDFTTNLANVNIPKKINLDLQIPLDDAVILLEKFKTEPTDLKPLFSDPTYKNWPQEVQYLTAVLTLKFYSNLSMLEADPEYRKSSLELLKHTVTFSPPHIATAFARLAIGNEWLFNTSIGPLAKMAVSTLAPNSETEELQLLSNFYVPDREKFQKAMDFSKTPERKRFDKARIALISSISSDVVDAILAKHTTDDSKLGENGKEFNIQKLVVTSLKNSQTLKESAIAMKEYLEELEKPVQNPEELKKKKAKVEATKGDSIGCSLKLYKSLSEVVASSENAQLLLNRIDEKVLPAVLENSLDLEKTPVHVWLQNTVLNFMIGI